MIDKAEFMSVSGLERKDSMTNILLANKATNLLFINSVMIISEFIILNSK